MVLLGEQQANLTGRRLREMYSNYKSIIHSTLIRAVQTATFIHQNLPHLAMISDDFIREGGPVAPQPPITYWSLPDRVSSRYVFLENLCGASLSVINQMTIRQLCGLPNCNSEVIS